MAHDKILTKEELKFFQQWVDDATQDAEDEDEHGKQKDLAGDAKARRIAYRLLKIYKGLVGVG